MYYIIDIDGTVSNPLHRLEYVLQVPKDNDTFHSLASLDPPYAKICNLAKSIVHSNLGNVYFVTGRPRTTLNETLEWLRKNVSYFIHKKMLLMANPGDRRPDFIVKEYQLSKLNITLDQCLFIDDRPSVRAYVLEKGGSVLDPGTWTNEDPQMKDLDKYLKEFGSGKT